ncbi:hypothetical protein [Winkia neuii]|uniref:hypothetical protein n=1 Tax=Winkia neuii TaxID=33007 RepID=UPI002556DEDE|nr:hypothetical protein [Winkia neuii]MDK8100724.1 hypothetical protein [Winkia neuii]
MNVLPHEVPPGGIVGITHGTRQGEVYGRLRGSRISWERVYLAVGTFCLVLLVGCVTQCAFVAKMGDVSAESWIVEALGFDWVDGPIFFMIPQMLLNPVVGMIIWAFASWSFIALVNQLGTLISGFLCVFGCGELLGNELGKWILYRWVQSGEGKNAFYDPMKTHPVELGADSSIFSSPWALVSAVIIVAVAIYVAYLMVGRNRLRPAISVTVLGIIGMIGVAIYHGQIGANLILIPITAFLVVMVFPLDVDAVDYFIKNKYPARSAWGLGLILTQEIIAIFTISIVAIS